MDRHGKFLGGKADYSEDVLKDLFGPGWKEITDNLLSIGFFREVKNITNLCT